MDEDVNQELRDRDDPLRAPPAWAQTERNNDWVDLFNQGCTFEDIARLRNTTREAVAGAIWRARRRGITVRRFEIQKSAVLKKLVQSKPKEKSA